MGAWACALAVAGCTHNSTVLRVYDGHVVEGHFVSAEAYAAFLRGTMAGAEGRAGEALEAYEAAASLQPSSPEIWTRIGELRCRNAAHDPRAEDAFARALSLDPSYAPAWFERAECALARGNVEAARASAARAVELDPGADGANVLLARTAPGAIGPDARARLVSLTATARDPVMAWDAMATWAESVGDVPLWAYALRELVGRVPSRRDAVARAAEELAGAGQAGEAQSVAAAAVDAASDDLAEGRPLAARLAVDESLARHDGRSARARATRTRLRLDEVAGRAWLAGDRALSRELAAEAARADSTARGARLMLMVCDGGDWAASASDGRPGDAPVPSAVLVAFGVAATRAVSIERARSMVQAMAGASEPIVNGDDRVVRPAVELASRGVLAPEMLPPDASLELSVLRADPAMTVGSLEGLDTRHEYLALSLRRPRSPQVAGLGKRLASVVGTDPIVAAAAALVQLATGTPIAPDAPRTLLARNAADPLLAAVALRLAQRVGDQEAERRARVALAAVGGTPTSRD